jgi:hypothetical protein
MKQALMTALAQVAAEERGVDRVLAASFFRTRPLQAGSQPIADLADHRRKLQQQQR